MKKKLIAFLVAALIAFILLLIMGHYSNPMVVLFVSPTLIGPLFLGALEVT